MSALICDICGGNLVMDETGEFAKCESCGMKHSKERVKAKVQEIKGVVEITKGEAEKERLLKNAETYLQLNEQWKAKEIYKQITNEYPDEWRGWFGLLKLELETLQKVVPGINDYEIKNYEKKCIKLNPQSCEEIEKIHEKYGYKAYYGEPEECFEYFKEKIEKGELCFSELGLTDCRGRKDVPNETLKKISELLKNNANRVNDELKAKGKSYKLINIFNIKKELFGIDDRPRMSDNYSYGIYHKLSKVVELKFLSYREAIYNGKFENNCERLEYIIFPDRLSSMDELIEELMKPTYEEQRENWKKEHLCELCGSKVDKVGICLKCGYLADEKFIVNKCKEILKLIYNAKGNSAEKFFEIREKFSENNNLKTIKRDITKYHNSPFFFKIRYYDGEFDKVERKFKDNPKIDLILLSKRVYGEKIEKEKNVIQRGELEYEYKTYPYEYITTTIPLSNIPKLIDYLQSQKKSLLRRILLG